MNVTRETLHQLVDVVEYRDIDLVCQILMRFVAEDAPLPDEVEAIRGADKSIAQFGTIGYDEINWD